VLQVVLVELVAVVLVDQEVVLEQMEQCKYWWWRCRWWKGSLQVHQEEKVLLF
jgi:hypothetical protein